MTLEIDDIFQRLLEKTYGFPPLQDNLQFKNGIMSDSVDPDRSLITEFGEPKMSFASDVLSKF